MFSRRRVFPFPPFSSEKGEMGFLFFFPGKKRENWQIFTTSAFRDDDGWARNRENPAANDQAGTAGSSFDLLIFLFTTFLGVAVFVYCPTRTTVNPFETPRLRVDSRVMKEIKTLPYPSEWNPGFFLCVFEVKFVEWNHQGDQCTTFTRQSRFINFAKTNEWNQRFQKPLINNQPIATNIFSIIIRYN